MDPLRVLIVEDSDRDVAREVRALKAAGYQVTYAVAATATEMKAALAEQAFDIVFADHDLPQFDAPGALVVLKQSGQDIPFIIVSGVIGEEIAVALMKAGAHDYVMKDKLARLVPAVQRELREAELRHEKKHTEEALSESESRYRSLVEKSFAGVYVVRDEHFTFLNNNAASFVGYRPDELVGKAALSIVHHDDIEMVRARTQSMLADEDSSPYEFKVVTKDGKVRWILGTVASIRYQGKPAILGNSMDITSRKVAEFEREEALEALTNEVARRRLLMEQSRDGIVILDQDGQVYESNRKFAEMLGYPLESMPQLNVIDWEFLHPAERVIEMIRSVDEKGDHFETRHRRRDGSTYYVEISTNAASFAGQKLIFCVCRDITDRKRSEEKLQKTLESLSKALNTTIQVLVSAVEVRDPYTAGHQQRVADLSSAIATEMEFPQDRIDGLHVAGVIHDIGKLSVPSEILLKPTKLTTIEFALIKEHPRSGYEMLKDVESPWPLAQIAFQHHERIDGSGYPQSLKGEEILMEARIMAVADVVESMASHRPYRPALGIDVALEEIERNKGTLYDDAVADACLRLFREKNFQLKNP